MRDEAALFTVDKLCYWLLLLACGTPLVAGWQPATHTHDGCVTNQNVQACIKSGGGHNRVRWPMRVCGLYLVCGCITPLPHD